MRPLLPSPCLPSDLVDPSVGLHSQQYCTITDVYGISASIFAVQAAFRLDSRVSCVMARKRCTGCAAWGPDRCKCEAKPKTSRASSTPRAQKSTSVTSCSVSDRMPSNKASKSKSNAQKDAIISTSSSAACNADQSKILELQIKQEKIRLATIQAETARDKVHAKMLKRKREVEPKNNWRYWSYHRNQQYYQRQRQRTWASSSNSQWNDSSWKRYDAHETWSRQQNTQIFNDEFYEGELELCYLNDGVN